MPKPKARHLARMRNTAKGSIHHMEIHPAKNSDGSQAFLTTIHRNPAAAAQQAMTQGGPYAMPPKPDETQHPDGQDMLDHVGQTFGVKPEDDGDSDED